MKILLIILLLALIASSCGFRKYVWFISIGYGAAIALIGAGLLFIFRHSLALGNTLECVLLIAYGCRLAGYLIYRDIKTAYNRRMKGEVKTNSDIPLGGKIGIWISASILYTLQTSPVTFRLMAHKGSDIFCIIGIVISALGLIWETTADLQKNNAKKKNPGQFVSTGLYRIVRCPNYLGEMIFWTGMFVSGLNIYHNALKWCCALLGFIGIVYVMFSGARRLEIRQDKNYGSNPDYQKYKTSTPIMIPFVPLYSVKKYKWLVA